MNATAADQLVAGYLARLRDALRDLPATRREELLEQVSEHIAIARAELDERGADAGEAEIRQLLERLGDPEAIAAAEAGGRPDKDAEPRRPRAGWMEVATLILLPIGGIVIPVFGWFVGVALLWASPRWSVRDKLLGTLVVPGGLALPGALGGLAISAQGCSSGPVQVSPIPPSSIASNTPVTVCTGGSPGWLQTLTAAGLVLLVLAPLATVIYLGRGLRHQPNITAA